jgi:adenylosuccinate synthase
MLNGIDALVVTKLDVLDELDEIKICVGYRRRDEAVEGMPYGANVLAECEPMYESAPGWKTDTSGLTEYEDLPVNAKNYIARIEELCDVDVSVVSTGPERSETIIRSGSPVTTWMR